ncbi:hypothetical protein GEV33_005831 [Tenebrio molitor]|uniref:Integrase catalytic domain-containing protein n=1 Tax=Tenebrio molitor TaxID=7067 RepID=A0A8J6HLS3_TENMO|nr:hypothetical protein GEV33_005831 [Tenebrio molitor]
MSRSPFRRRSNRLNKVLDLVHTDVCGPIRTHSLGGAKYFIEFIDDASRWCEVRFLKSKAEVSKATTEYIALVEIQKGKKIKCFQSDNGAEYTGKEFNDYLKKRGITRRLTAPYNPEQNGTAERKNRTLLDSAKCLLQKESNLRNSFWAEAVNTANYRLPTKSLDGRTPYEVWTDKVPDISHFSVFGARVFHLDQELEEFDSRGQEGIFLGYAVQSVSLRPTGWVEPGTKLIKKERQTPPTRPDISFAVSHLGQFNNCYGEEHWTAAKRVLLYLKGTADLRLVYDPDSEPLTGFVDADWGSCTEDRRSFTGYIFLLNGGPVSWDSRKQRTVALSTTEAELSCVLRQQRFIETGGEPHIPRDVLRTKKVTLEHVPTDHHVTDFLTKGLPRMKHSWCVVSSGLSVM